MNRIGTRALYALTATLALFAAGAAMATPNRLDCTLTKAQTKSGAKFSVDAENRQISVVFDEATKKLSVSQKGEEQALDHVTITPISMSGYVDDTSLGIDVSSWSVVLQTYKTGSVVTESGSCGAGAKAAN